MELVDELLFVPDVDLLEDSDISLVLDPCDKDGDGERDLVSSVVVVDERDGDPRLADMLPDSDKDTSLVDVQWLLEMDCVIDLLCDKDLVWDSDLDSDAEICVDCVSGERLLDSDAWLEMVPTVREVLADRETTPDCEYVSDGLGSLDAVVLGVPIDGDPEIVTDPDEVRARVRLLSLVDEGDAEGVHGLSDREMDVVVDGEAEGVFVGSFEGDPDGDGDVVTETDWVSWGDAESDRESEGKLFVNDVVGEFLVWDIGSPLDDAVGDKDGRLWDRDGLVTVLVREVDGEASSDTDDDGVTSFVWDPVILFSCDCDELRVFEDSPETDGDHDNEIVVDAVGSRVREPNVLESLTSIVVDP
jgi:hypothetical protein